MGDIIGLDYNAVLSVMDLYDVKDKKTFEAVLMCFNLEQEFAKEQS